jgi:hypothetical protein
MTFIGNLFAAGLQEHDKAGNVRLTIEIVIPKRSAPYPEERMRLIGLVKETKVMDRLVSIDLPD